MLFLLIQVDLIAQVDNFAIDAYTHIASTTHLLKDILVLTFTPLDQWGKQHDTRTFGQIEYGIDNLLNGLLAYLAATIGAVGMANACEQQAHIVVDLGDGAN